MRGVSAGCAIALLAGLIQAGCAQNPYALQSQITTLQQQQTALVQRDQEIQSRASTLDQDNQDLHTQLAQEQRQARLYQDQSVALREQLASTTALLAQSQQDKQLVERNAQAIVASTKRRAGVTITPNSSLAKNLPALNLPGVFVRQDGDVVRIEISGDQIFEPGGAQLRADSANLLDAVAAEIERTYPEQIIGIEGHTDNDPPPPPWASPHQFTMGRAMAVFDYLSTRTHLRPNQLFLVGHGANHPVVSNATLAGKARNRRIELVVYPDRIGQ
ncbi:MAG TPA: OmpA family protein [Pirellulales bacterium]|nr:OmpA family protein [Pirellulales bacterium]